MKKTEKNQKAIKYWFNTMVGVDTHLKKQIDLAVDDKYLGWVTHVTIGL